MLIRVGLVYLALIHVELIVVVMLIDERVVVEENMAVLYADSSPDLALSISGTCWAHSSRADKTYRTTRMVYLTTCCPYCV